MRASDQRGKVFNPYTQEFASRLHIRNYAGTPTSLLLYETLFYMTAPAQCIEANIVQSNVHLIKGLPTNTS